MKKLFFNIFIIFFIIFCFSCNNDVEYSDAVVEVGTKDGYSRFAANKDVDYTIYFIVHSDINSDGTIKYQEQYDKLYEVASQEDYADVNFISTNFYYTGLFSKNSLSELQKIVSLDIKKALKEEDFSDNYIGTRFPILLAYKEGEVVNGVRGVSDNIDYTMVIKNLLKTIGYNQ